MLFSVSFCDCLGCFQFVDTSGIPSPSYYQISLPSDTYLNSLAFSSSGEHLTFGDCDGTLYTFEYGENAVINAIDEQVEYVQPYIDPPPTTIAEHDSLDILPPLYSDSPFFSVWDPSSCFYSPPCLPPIDSSLISNLKWNDWLGSLTYIESEEFKIQQRLGVKQGKFQQERKLWKQFTGRGRLTEQQAQKKTTTTSLRHYAELLNSPLRREWSIPKEYARVTIVIPKLGLYAFDFSSYNKTHFTGLDNLLPNSYVNSFLQVLYFQPIIHQYCLQHLCERENCLMCQLGFLFRKNKHSNNNDKKILCYNICLSDAFTKFRLLMIDCVSCVFFCCIVCLFVFFCFC